MSSARNVDLHYERRGTGTALLLLHGIGHRWQAWEPVLSALAREHDVVAVDLPGFGLSPPLPGVEHPHAIAMAVAAFARQLGLDHPHVAGNSLGGAIALELAAADLVSTATALSPAGFSSPREARRAVAMLTALRRTTFLSAPLLHGVMRPVVLRSLALGMVVHRPSRLDPDRAFSDARALRNGQAFPAVARQLRRYCFFGVPQAPVTVAWGIHDRVLPHRQAAVARRRLPGARHVDLLGCGHVPMSDEPGLVASTILATTKGA